jgi:hypothetical protein
MIRSFIHLIEWRCSKEEADDQYMQKPQMSGL